MAVPRPRSLPLRPLLLAVLSVLSWAACVGGQSNEEMMAFIMNTDFSGVDTCVVCMMMLDPLMPPCAMRIMEECKSNPPRTNSTLWNGSREVDANACREAASGVSGPSLAVHMARGCIHPTNYEPKHIGNMLEYAMMWPKEIADSFVAAGMNGHALKSASVPTMINMGVPPGMAIGFDLARDNFMEANAPVHPNQAEGTPANIQPSVIVSSIYGIDEKDFSFQASFTLILTWIDLSLFGECDKVGEDKVFEEGCEFVWRPGIDFVNAREVEIVSTAIETDQSLSTVMYSMFVRGTFSAPMGFRRFPGDIQDLPIDISLENKKFVRSDYIFADVVAKFAPQFFPEGGKDSVSGWVATDVQGLEKPMLPVDLKSAGGTAGPLYELITTRQQAMVASGGDLESVNKIAEMSCASFVIRVERVKNFYMMNYVMLVVLLTSMSWVVFLVDASSLSDRCQIALALVLALNVFQLILNDTMPETGYLTPMHEYIIGSTFFIMLTTLESVIAMRASKNSAVRAAGVSKIQGLVGAGRWGGHKNEVVHSAEDDEDPPTQPGNGWPLPTKEAAASRVNGTREGRSSSPLPEVGESSAVIKCEEWAARHLDQASLVLFPI
eukprot:CAMPEP_0182909390 /NCGR_PEP_ID=MMETSP0034_2-20130328/35729_1 /TAXON_ID=156128 /ORGANISM="Nephroselmis pyriformis, Strain CCMP717" /LENGTH=608 /DNA_ID=CAMNT_0025045641 /DNA_START=47 /DNA_END=1870 /DNA_ORIENTATION=+